MTLVLASTSPWRAEMLRNAGVEIECVPPGVDEDEMKLALRSDGVLPRDQADALAEMKARRVSSRVPGVLVLGADQVLDFKGDALDKPQDAAAARETLRRLRGERHELLSAAVIALDGAPIWRHIGRARLFMRPFSDAFITEYLASIGEDALQTPGAYMLEGLGAQLFSRIDGDYFTILGLPLIETLGFLRVRGILTE
ncbi:MAG: nucleoside triphosphate pyrophosphatase [Pseudomonadota bacterium]